MRDLLGKINYHITIAKYFSFQSHFFDGDQQKKPRIRKCMELPFQQTRAHLWDAVTNTLCDLEFIQAKACAKMTYDLVKDFNEVLEKIPDNAENIMQEKARQARLEKYARDLVAYAKGEIKELEIPDTLTLKSEEEINAEIERMKTNPTRLDKILEMNDFILTYEDLIRETDIPVSQLLFNRTDSGPLSQVFSENKTALPTETWIQLENRPKVSINLLINTIWIPPVSEFHLKTTCDFKQAVLIFNKGLMVFDTKKNSIPKVLNYTEGIADCFSITQDGKYVVAAYHDTITTWNANERKIVKQFIINEITNNIIDNEDLLDISINPDETKLILLSRKKNINNIGLEEYYFIRVFDKDGLLSHKFSKSLKGFSYDQSMCTRLDGAKISFIDKTTLWLWDLVNDKCIPFLSCRGNDLFISHTATNNFSHIAISSINGNLYIIKLDNGEVKTIFNTHKGGPSKVSISADASIAAIGDNAGDIHIWDLNKQTLLKSFKAHSSGIVNIILASDGSKVISTALDSNEMRIWNIFMGFQSAQDPLDEKLRWNTSSYFGNKKAIADSLLYLRLQVGESIKWKDLCNFLHSHSPLDEIHVVTQDERIAIGEQQIGRQVVGKLDIKNNQILLCENIPYYSRNCIDLSPDGRYTYIGKDNEIFRWDIETNSCISIIKDTEYSFNLLKVSPSGDQIATGDKYRNPIRLWDLNTGLWETPGGPIDTSNKLLFLPDGRGIVGDYNYNMFSIWDMKKSTIKVNEPYFMSQDIGTLNIWPDGNLIIKTYNRLLSIYSTDGNRIASYYSNRGAILHVEIFGNGFILFIEDGSIELTTIKNPPPFSPAIATAVRLWRYGDTFSSGSWDVLLSAICGWCNNRVEVPGSIIRTIKAGCKEYYYSEENLKDFNIPDFFWNNPNLIHECPSCHMLLKFNPFIVDNKDRFD